MVRKQTMPARSPRCSADGRYVLFYSFDSNLVPEDTNSASDIFLHDRQAGTTERVSVAWDGSQANGNQYYPSISSDGRFVAFASEASNLVPGDTNISDDIFIRDRQLGTTYRVNTAWDGSQSEAQSSSPSMSSDGFYVAFQSYASNLVPGDTNALPDIFTAVNLPFWQAQAATASLTVGGTVNEMETGARPLPGEIRGRGFHDLDRDGLRDIGEPGLVDWTIYLDLNANGTFDGREPVTTTDSQGNYLFKDLTPFTTYIGASLASTVLGADRSPFD